MDKQLETGVGINIIIIYYRLDIRLYFKTQLLNCQESQREGNISILTHILKYFLHNNRHA